MPDEALATKGPGPYRVLSIAIRCVFAVVCAGCTSGNVDRRQIIRRFVDQLL